MEPIIVIMTYPNNSRQLKKLILEILHKGLAKCINRVNYVKSYYLWEGKIKKDEEKILMIKTTTDKKDTLEKLIKNKHPYDIPELIYISPTEVEKDYLQWLTK